MYPEVNQIKIEAMNSLSSLKSIVNQAKNSIASESTEIAKLKAFKDSETSTEAEKATMQAAIDSLANISTAINAEGF